MRLFNRLFLALLLLVVSGATVIMSHAATPAKPQQYCTDLAGVLTEPQRVAINEKLAQLEKDTSAQFLVYIDKSLNGKAVEDFGREAFRSWGVGQKGKNNGLVFFVFTADRKMRVEVGYGLEGAIPDSTAKSILAQGAAPLLKRGAENWNAAVAVAVNQLETKVRQEGGKPTTGPPKQQTDFFGSGSQSSSSSSSATLPSSVGSSPGASSKPSAQPQEDQGLVVALVVGLLVVVAVGVVVALMTSRLRAEDEERARMWLSEQVRQRSAAALLRREAEQEAIDRRYRERQRQPAAPRASPCNVSPAVVAAVAIPAGVAAARRPKPKPTVTKEEPVYRRRSSDDDGSSRSSWSSSSNDSSSSSSSYDSGGGSCGGGGASSDF